jgi:hypothetical protein
MQAQCSTFQTHASSCNTSVAKGRRDFSSGVTLPGNHFTTSRYAPLPYGPQDVFRVRYVDNDNMVYWGQHHCDSAARYSSS